MVNTQAEEARMPAVAVRTQGAVARIRVVVPGRVAARRLVWRNNNGFCTSYEYQPPETSSISSNDNTLMARPLKLRVSVKTDNNVTCCM